MRSYEMKDVAKTHISEARPYGEPETVDDGEVRAPGIAIAELETSKKGRFAYFKTKQFYIVLILG